MTTTKRKQLKQIGLCFILVLLCRTVWAQHEGYLANRIKPGDVMYIDGQGQERFVDYREWDKNHPLGEVIGVVFYSYYGVAPYALDDQPGWHGWLMAPDESGLLAWAPQNTACYNRCVASYAVEGVETPYNPNPSNKHLAMADTCGWQNTYRLLAFLYEDQHTSLSTATSPAFHYLFATKNGVTDFSVKPTMERTSWFMPSYGMLRMMYGQLGCLNNALLACGGTLMDTSKCWYSSTEFGNSDPRVVWSLNGYGYSYTNTGWFKSDARTVRAVRIF
jgi:hypothetical protein